MIEEKMSPWMILLDELNKQQVTWIMASTDRCQTIYAIYDNWVDGLKKGSKMKMILFDELDEEPIWSYEISASKALVEILGEYNVIIKPEVANKIIKRIMED